MTNIDYMLAGGLILLLLIVVLRVYLGRRKQAESVSGGNFKTPRKSVEKAADHSGNAELNVPVSAVQPAPGAIHEPKFAHEKNEEHHHENERAAEAHSRDLNESYTDFIDDPVTIIKTFSMPREKRIKAIQEAGNKRMVEAVPALIEALYEPDGGISLAASESLGEIGDPRAIEPLIEVSRRSDAVLMREMPGGDGDYVQANHDVTEAEVSDASANPFNFKEMIVFKIDQLPQEYFMADGSPIPRKDLVIKGLKDNNQQMRQMAAKAAIGLEHDDVVDPLIEALDNPFEVESVRFMAAEALGGMQSDKSVESLLRALKDENVAVRYSAAAALSGRCEDRIIMVLIESLSDPDRYVRSSIAYALGASGDKRALQTLFTAITDESEVVRFSAAKAIACFPADEVLDEISLKLHNSDRVTLLALLEVLGHIKDEKSVNILRGYLRSMDSEISYKASTALMGQENDEIIDDLIQASRRLDEELLHLMKEKMGQESFPARAGAKSAKTEEVKAAGEKSLESFKNLPPNLEKLRKGLLDQSPNIRGSAANTLGDFPAGEAVALLAAVRKDKNEFVRSSVVNSLGKIGSEEAVKLIISLEGDNSEEVRYAVVKALAGKAFDGVTECLKRIASGDKAKNVKRAARLALEKPAEA